MKRFLTVALMVSLAGCSATSTQRRPAAPPASPPASLVPPPPGAALPPPAVAPEEVPDAIPRPEPRSAYGNPPFYDQFGTRYFVLASSVGYVERGVASWYGPGFHAERTATREPYDMYGMTAAHKTLPLPCYARVTNLQNGHSIVVRINDRGPFVANRLIDLSYTAAAKLDMLKNGTAMVEVRTIDPYNPADAVITTAASAPANTQISTPVNTPAGPPAAASAAGLFLQAGAFADPANAARLLAKLQNSGYGPVFVREYTLAGRKLYRVRIGPIADVAEFDRVVGALDAAGIHGAHLALD